MKLGVPLSPISPAHFEQVQRTSLTHQQKLEALAYRFYHRQTWTPKPGDFYTTARADLELYQVVSVEDGIVKTRYVDPARGAQISEWDEATFLSPETFGYARVWVPDWLMSQP